MVFLAYFHLKTEYCIGALPTTVMASPTLNDSKEEKATERISVPEMKNFNLVYGLCETTLLLWTTIMN